MSERKTASETTGSEFDERVAALAKKLESRADARQQRAAAERRRRRRRRLLTAIGLPVAIVAGVFAGKFVSQHLAASIVTQQFAAGNFEGALNTSSQLHWLNLVETWKADYDTGTSLLGAQAYAESEAALRSSLELAVPAEQCPIRANLAIAIESQGDDAYFGSDFATAKSRYEEALQVITEADPTCSASSAAGSLDESEPRLREKIRRLEEEQPPSPPQGDGGDSEEQQPGDPKPDALDNLEEQLDKNKSEREDDLGGGGGGFVDKPW